MRMSLSGGGFESREWGRDFLLGVRWRQCLGEEGPGLGTLALREKTGVTDGGRNAKRKAMDRSLLLACQHNIRSLREIMVTLAS